MVTGARPVNELLGNIPMKMTRKFRFRFLLILLLTNMLVGCEIDTEISVSVKNPPQITLSGTNRIHRLYILGPFTKEEIDYRYSPKAAMDEAQQKQTEKALEPEHLIWEIDPADVSSSHIPAITYGTLSSGLAQIFPPNGQRPVPLTEGNYYVASVADYEATAKITIFRIHNGKTEKVAVKTPWEISFPK